MKGKDEAPNEDVTAKNRESDDPYADLDDAMGEEQRRGDRTAMDEE